MTGVDVEHTKALEAAATPGPWAVNGYGNLAAGNRPLGKIRPAADAEFIAHARTVVPALVAAVERVQALHTPWPPPSLQTYCRTCAHPMPCPTRQALETP